MPLPTEPIGSIPRPPAPIAAIFTRITAGVRGPLLASGIVGVA